MKKDLTLECKKCGTFKMQTFTNCKYAPADLGTEVRPKIKGHSFRCSRCFYHRWRLIQIKPTLEVEIDHLVEKFRKEVLKIFGKYGE